MTGALLFTWLQGAEFYRSLHAVAVANLPSGNGGLWIDVGCGPGLVTRLAAEHGYRANGVDRSRAMTRAARWLARGRNSRVIFSNDDIATLPEVAADVVSAASLLVVLENARSGLQSLWRCVRPGGHLLIVEATSSMTKAVAEPRDPPKSEQPGFRA